MQGTGKNPNSILGRLLSLWDLSLGSGGSHPTCLFVGIGVGERSPCVTCLACWAPVPTLCALQPWFLLRRAGLAGLCCAGAWISCWNPLPVAMVPLLLSSTCPCDCFSWSSNLCAPGRGHAVVNLRRGGGLDWEGTLTPGLPQSVSLPSPRHRGVLPCHSMFP